MGFRRDLKKRWKTLPWFAYLGRGSQAKVIGQGNRVWGVEVKTARSVKPSDFRGLHRLAEQAGADFQSGIVFYTGDSILPTGDDRFLGVPISKLWEL